MTGAASLFVVLLPRRRCFIAVILALLVLPVPAVPQNTTGRIIGTVTDEQGSTIPDAKVVVTNTDTRAHWDSRRSSLVCNLSRLISLSAPTFT
jgi:hypothetical protein